MTFDEALHEYRVDGQVKPSVTQLLGALSTFGMVPADVLAAACERGTYVHLAAQYFDEGDLGPVEPQFDGYVEAWRRFMDERKPRWTGIEVQGYSARYGYAGTFDRAGFMGETPWIVDIKTAAQPHRVWGLQLSAYRQLAAEGSTNPAWRTARLATVQLAADGSYRFKEWSDPDAWPVFVSLINLTNWNRK